MRLFSKHILLATAALSLTVSGIASAQEANFAPVMATFSGKGALLLPTSPALDLGGSGTIEFWVAAKWSDDPGYDPAIMANTGPKGARFAIVVTGDREQLGVFAGQNYATLPFDFTDGQLHYVALTVIGDSIAVMIDGEEQGVLDFGLADLNANSFSVGSMGKFSPFIGEIGQIRIWDEPIDSDVLIDFSWKPITSEGPSSHPDIDSLVGVSAFGNPETGGFIFVGEPDDPLVAAAKVTPIDDSDLDLTSR